MHKKQSLFQISKRDTLPLSKALLIRGGILLLALIFCGLITTILTGKNPLSVYATILSGAFGKRFAKYGQDNPRRPGFSPPIMRKKNGRIPHDKGTH